MNSGVLGSSAQETRSGPTGGPGAVTPPGLGQRGPRGSIGQRRWIHPRVYRDLIVNVALLGAPCTGKTTLARALAEEFGTIWMPECGREYWERHQVNRRLTPQQLVEIAEGHLEREDARLLDANRHLFTDTNALTTRLFALAYHGRAEPRLEELAMLAERRYDLVVVCDADFPYVDTWDGPARPIVRRFSNASWRTCAAGACPSSPYAATCRSG